jgi:hypothetical protein
MHSPGAGRARRRLRTRDPIRCAGTARRCTACRSCGPQAARRGGPCRWLLRAEPPFAAAGLMRAVGSRARSRLAVGGKPMTRATGHDEEVTGTQVDRALAVELDAEGALPAQEQLVLVVRVPRELTLTANHSHDRLVDVGEVDAVPRLLQALDHAGDRDARAGRHRSRTRRRVTDRPRDREYRPRARSPTPCSPRRGWWDRSG